MITNIKDFKLNESFEYIKPINRNQLKTIIDITISKLGNECNLNFIDNSLITDMSGLFQHSTFNGDISKWNVGNVTRWRSRPTPWQ